MSLPSSSHVPVEPLSNIFGKVTNSYKFYWFLAILDYVREKQSPNIPIDELLARMVAGVWYPTNYFRLSFGKQDRLSDIALELKQATGLSQDADRRDVVDAVQSIMREDSSLARKINSLAVYVPYRFLRPFFVTDLQGLPDWKANKRIEELAENVYNDPQNPCMYHFVGGHPAHIEINIAWFHYVQTHMAILTGFCLWHLLNYLQKNNPNVPNVSAKLFEPYQRDLSRGRRFWRLAFEKFETIHCIYSGQIMRSNQFTLDHFLPWRFVTHDLLWNLVPTPKDINSAKSDRLPDLEKYFDSFAQLQFDAVQAVATTATAGLLEDYVLIFRVSSIQDLRTIQIDNFCGILRDTIAPQVQVAKNMGFVADWQYS
jgi:hypothetical protein